MTPSSPFHPPGNHPLSYVAYANNPGVIGEPPGSRRQTPEPAPHPAGNGDILLQLLQGGNGDGRLGQASQHLSAPQQHGIGGADDVPASWLLDPALASLGPSHPYHQQLLVQQQGMVTGGDVLHSALLKQQQQHQMQQPNFHHQLQQQQPPYVSQFIAGQATLGRPQVLFHQQQQQSSLERAFNGASRFPPIQAPVPAPQGVMAPSFSSRYVQGHPDQQRTLEPSWPSPQQVRQPAADAANGASGRTWAAPQSSPQQHQPQQQRQPQASYYGNGGVDLLQLLLGNTASAQSTSSPSPSLRAGVEMGVDGKPLQKSSSVVVHGPIGPPKRSDSAASAGQEDLLGRFWAPPTAAYDLGSKSGLLHHRDDHFGQDSILDRSLMKDQLLHVGDLRQSAEHHSLDLRLLGLNMPSLPESEPPGFSYPQPIRSSPLLSERLESKDARPFGGGWAGAGKGRTAADRDHTGLSHLQRVIGNHQSSQGRLREDMYLSSSRSSDMSVPTGSNHPDSQDQNFKDWPFENEFSRESVRDPNRGGRRGGSSNSVRGEGSRRGGRQWVAVNDKQRDKDVEILQPSAGIFRDQMDTMERGSSMSGTLLLTKEESKLRVEEGAPQKIRDDSKRRRGHQQEWRMKQPVQSANHILGTPSDGQAIDSVASARSANEVECSDGSAASLSPFLAPSLASQLDHPGLPASSLPGSSPGTALEEALQHLHAVEDRAQENGYRHALVGLENDDELRKEEEEELLREFNYLDLDDQDTSVHDNSQQLQAGTQTSHEEPENELTSRQQRVNSRPDSNYRPDIENITTQLLSIYEALIPLEEEENRRRQFLAHLEDLVAQDWPGARLFLYGSCANAFGVCNSDIDICLSVNDDQFSKAELVTRMANILRIHNMHNVQALTHARVPIVKFTDSVTGISCDICVNNMLAVVNSKLLHDYSQVDVRLRQLAFIVKHWAKRRQVNETYRGTLSSYAYVLMCIHFLQQRKPAILPCLQQGLPATYQVKIGRIECAYYNKVETLANFGSQNKETLGELVIAFFEYWAFRHDYNRAVVSVRTGTFLSKEQKDWTRRIGNERHLICIEDPFEVTHDLGRVVDRHSIRVLRDEFYRAAKILRHDVNACASLFEPFIREK